MIPISIRLAVSCAVLGALAACGGGSSGSDGAGADAGTAAAVAPATSAARGFHHQSERVSLAAASYAAPAIGGTITAAVDRLDGSTGAASVGFATADGTAVAGTSYTATNGRLSWDSGDASPKTFKVKVADNTSTSKSRTGNA